MSNDIYRFPTVSDQPHFWIGYMASTIGCALEKLADGNVDGAKMTLRISCTALIEADVSDDLYDLLCDALAKERQNG